MKEIFANFKIKKFTIPLVMSMLVLFSGILFACNNTAKNLKLQASASQVVLYLGDEQQDNATLSILASNANESVLKDLYVSSTSNKIKITQQKYIENGETQITIKALAQTENAIVSVSSKRDLNKKVDIRVKVINPITSISPKTSQFSNYVVKGQSALLDKSLVKIEPEETLESGLKFEVVNNPSPEYIKIENNRLVVDKDLSEQIERIDIAVSSTHRDVAPATLSFYIIEGFTRQNIEINAITSGKNLNPENLEDLKPIYLARNDISARTEEIEVKVTTNRADRNIEVIPVLENHNGEFIQMDSSAFEDGAHYFTISPYKEPGVAYLYFKVKYTNFDYEFSTQSFKTQFLAFDIIKNIQINGQVAEEEQSAVLFSDYAEAYQGEGFVFEALPTTVANEFKNFYLETLDYSPDTPAENKINIFTRNASGTLSPLVKNQDGKLQILNGQEVIFRANKTTSSKTAEVTVISEFSAEYYKGTEKEQRVKINFEIIRGVETAEVYGFEDGQNAVVLNSGKQDRQKVYFAISKQDADVIRFVSFEANGNFVVEEETVTKEVFDANIDFDATNKALYSVYVKSLNNSLKETGRLTIHFGNGRKLVVNVNTEIEFEKDKLNVSSQRVNENMAVGFYKQNPNDFASFKVAVKSGLSAKLLHNLPQETFDVSYSFLSAEYSQDEEALYNLIDGFTRSDVIQRLDDFKEETTIINARDLSQYGIILPIGMKAGKVIVQAVYTGKQFAPSSNGKYQVLKQIESGQSVIKYFVIETYIPVTNFDVKINQNFLYSAESVGYYNRHLTQAVITTSLNAGGVAPTYATINVETFELETGERISLIQSSTNKNVYNLTALSVYHADYQGDAIKVHRSGYIEFSINEFGRKQSKRIPIIINHAEKVAGIAVNNVNEQTGIYLNVHGEQSFKIEAQAENLTAFNKGLVYTFEADAGVQNPTEILQINENTGVITLKDQGYGGTGKIIIYPQDAFMLNKLGQKELSLSNTVAKVIKIVVADGKTKATAFQIADLSGITDSTDHYILTASQVDLPSDWKATRDSNFSSFSGGLYGKLNEQDEPTQITFRLDKNASALFNVLGKNAIIEDLILVGEINDGSQGFLANTNNGTIRNVTVDTYIKNNLYSPSILTNLSSDFVGGIVGANSADGKILSSHFFGSIAGSAKNAGGLVGQNAGKIENSTVEFYTFENGVTNSISATTYAGGLVGKNEASGNITLSYANSYHDKAVLTANNMGALVGEADPTSVITKSFARTNALTIAGNHSQSNGTELGFIKNSYHFVYDPQDADKDDEYVIINSDGKVYNNGPSILSSTNTTAFYSFYSNRKVTFSTQTQPKWQVSTIRNNGYPYLLEITKEEYNIDSKLKLKQSADVKVLTEDEEQKAIFYFYQPLDTHTLTTQEQAVIRNWNTHTFESLFGVSGTQGLRVVGSSTNAIRFFSNSIELIAYHAGEITLEVFSKYDYSIKNTFTVSIVYALGNFSVSHEEKAIINNSVIKVKGGTNQVVKSNIHLERVAVNRSLVLKQNADITSVLFANAVSDQDLISTATSSVHSIDTTKFGDKTYVNFDAYAQIRLKDENNNNYLDATENEKHYINKLLKSNSKINFGFSTYTGPFSIETTQKEIVRMMPNDIVSFEVEVISDNPDEELKIDITDQNNSNIFNASSDKPKYAEIFTNSLTEIASEEREDLENGRYKLTYRIVLEVKDEYKHLNFDNVLLNLNIKSTDDVSQISARVELSIASQEIQHISLNTKEFVKWSAEGGFEFKPEASNVISPGKKALITVNLYPKLSYFDSLEITSSVHNSTKISFAVLEKDDIYKRVTDGFIAITDGIKILNSEKGGVFQHQDGQSNLSMIYIYATMPSNVQQDTVFTITITARDGNGVALYTSTALIIAQPLIAAEITIGDSAQKSIVMARGTEETITVSVEGDQRIKQLLINPEDTLNDEAEVRGITLIGTPTESIDQTTGKRIYKQKIRVSELTKFFNTSTPSFSVTAVVVRVVGDVTEEVERSIKIFVVDFLILEDTFRIDTDKDVTNRLETHIGIGKELKFDVDTTEWVDYGASIPEFQAAVEELREKVKDFKDHNYYYSHEMLGGQAKYILNNATSDRGEKLYKNYLNNLYYINANGSSTKVLSGNGSVIQSEIIDFKYMEGNGVSSIYPSGKSLQVVGKRTGTQNLRLVFPYITPDGARKEVMFDFSVVVTPYTSEDKPNQIYTAQEFLEIQNEQEPQDYILMNDIYLYEYIPFNTRNIRSLDGNNMVISIVSFDLDLGENERAISLSLFTTVTSDTTLKNIIVNYYHLDKILINTAKFTTINIAGFAIDNLGIITNSHVLSFKLNPNMPSSSRTRHGFEVIYSSGTTPIKIGSATTSNISGFVITNASGGSITNSRVGGTQVDLIANSSNQITTYALQQFWISGQGTITGFAISNSGNIAASYSNNIGIDNATIAGRETITSGFVGTNSGKITLSYAKGGYNPIYPNEVRTTGTGISTSSIGAGFVYSNSGIVSDSYSNIMIKDRAGNAGRASAGFVYSNTNTGLIEKAFAASVIENSSSNQMNFTGVDENSNLNNQGKIVNSYYYSPQSAGIGDSGDVEQLYTSGVLRIDSFTNTDIFYGFSFATPNSMDGVWKLTSNRGIDLVSANEVAISNRYFNPIIGTENDFNLPYTDGYAYGSVRNPIIIRTAQEFNQVFGDSISSDISAYYNLQNQTIFGNYRLVSDIDLRQLSINQTGEYKLNSSNMSLIKNATFDGNNLTISNLQLFSSINHTNKNYGLFASVEGGATVKNLIVRIIDIEASNIENVGAVTGALINSKLINLQVVAQNTSTGATVLGQNVVGGVVGLVTGDSAIIGLSTNNVSVVADYFDNTLIKRQGFARKTSLDLFNHKGLSYAGGVAGIIDIFSTEKTGNYEYQREEVMSFASSSALKVEGINQVRGGTVGGVIGYVGLNTFIRDASYEINLNTETRLQKIISYGYAAGGVVGELLGNLTQSKIQHNKALQEEIEANIANYYRTTQQVTRGNESLFIDTTSNYAPTFVGGLVGQAFSGEISNSYSRANVIAPNANFVGGIFGGIGDFIYPQNNVRKLGETRIEEVYFFGDIKSKVFDESYTSGAGGVAGFIEYLDKDRTDSILVDGVNAIIYLSKSPVENTDVEKEDNEVGVFNYKNTYDFYAFTNINGEHKSPSDFLAYNGNLAAEKQKEIIQLEELGGGERSLKTYLTKQFKVGQNTYLLKQSAFNYDSENKVIKNKVIDLNEIISVANDGKNMDVIFRNNNWEPTMWNRDSQRLLPDIVFTASTSVIIIEEAKDFLLMQKYPDKIFIIKPNNGQYLIDMGSVTSNMLNIENFNGILKGYVDETQEETGGAPLYGIRNLRTSNSLIKSSSNGAVFADLVIAFSGSSTMTDGGILVNQASGTIFRNIVVKDSYMETTSTSAGVIVGSASNAMFDTISVEHSLARDMVTQNITKEIIYDQIAKQTGQDIVSFSAGGIVGKVSSSIRTTFRNVKVSVTSQGTGSRANAVVVNGLSGSVPRDMLESVKQVNIGGIYGTATESVQVYSEIIDGAGGSGRNTLVEGVELYFTGSRHEINGETIHDLYEVNAGAIGGKSSSVYYKTSNVNLNEVISADIKIEGALFNNTQGKADFPSAAVGGLFGSVNSITIQTQEEQLGQSSKIDINVPIQINNTVKTFTDIAPHIYVGGIIGYSSGMVNIKNITVGGRINRFGTDNGAKQKIDLKGTSNYFYISGGVAGIGDNSQIENINILSGVEFKLDNGSSSEGGITRFGGIVGRMSNKKGNINTNVKKSIFNGRFLAENSKQIFAGGIVGAMGNISSQTNITENYFGGQIDIVRNASNSIVAGGIVGAVSEVKGDDTTNPDNTKLVKVEGNIAYGDINIEVKSIGNDSVILGGIVGEGADSLVVSNNISLTTLYSNRTAVSQNVSAIIGFVNSKDKPRGSGNKYVSQLNLATDEVENNNGDKFSQNKLYSDILNDISGISDILNNQFSGLGVNDAQNGYKLAPYIISENSSVQANFNKSKKNAIYRNYFLFSTQNKKFAHNGSPINLDKDDSDYNYAIIGDGVEIELNNNQGMLFNSIDDKSFASGISVNPKQSAYPKPFNSEEENKYEYKYYDNNELKTIAYPISIYGGFVAVNHGVIFGSNVKANTQIGELENKNFYTEIFLQNTNLAGGFVGLNKGYIADSFASAKITNITQERTKSNITQFNEKLFEGINDSVEDKFVSYNPDAKSLKITPITSGFVGINEGDIHTSYSNGVISAYSSITFAFGGDNGNIRFNGKSHGGPSVRKSFTLTQSSNAFSELIQNENENTFDQKLHANVFGYGADSSNFYDIYATQTKDKHDYAQLKVTSSIVNKLQLWDKIDFTSFDLPTNMKYNFGYPAFLKGYKEEDFSFMRQNTAIDIIDDYSHSTVGGGYIIPNLGVLQALSEELGNSGFENVIYMINDMEITEDMGWVSANQSFEESADKQNENWDAFSISNTEVQGLGNNISGFRVFAGSKHNQTKYSLGFFTEIENSIINNVIVSNSEVVTELKTTSKNPVQIGAFAGKMKDSTIENSYNLGVSVIGKNYGIAGGLVGHIINSSIKNSVNAGTVSLRWKEGAPINDNLIKANFNSFAAAGGIYGLAGVSGNNVALENIANNTNYGFVHTETKNIEPGVIYLVHTAGIGLHYDTNMMGQTNTNRMLGFAINQYYDDNGYYKFTSVNSYEYFNINASKGDFDQGIYEETQLDMVGGGTKHEPYIINTPQQFEQAYEEFYYESDADFNVLLNTNVNLNQLEINLRLSDSSAYYVFDLTKGENSLNILGNNKLLIYEGEGVIEAENNGAHLINKLNETSKILNLNLLANHSNTTYASSLLVGVNSGGLIKQTNVYGSSLPQTDKVSLDKDEYVSAFVLNNEKDGRVELSNNYALLKAASGSNAPTAQKDASNAVNIGGIVGKTSGNIINSINYGVLIGGDGGQGANGSNGANAGELQKRGGTGGKGTNGGDASLIGGVVAKAEQSSITSGNNLGTIISGNGGNGGNGGIGGKGGDGVADYANEYRGVIATSVADLSAAWERLKSTFVSGEGGAGGGGGAGGNGGNTIAGGIAGVSYSSSISSFDSKSSLKPFLISGTPGLGGRGGDGGEGGKGMVAIEPVTATLITTNIASLLLPPYTTTPLEVLILVAKINGMALVYKNAGDGGGAGGTGFSGNTIETTQNAFIIKDESKAINAQPGGMGLDPTRHGGGSQSIEVMTGEYGNTKDKTEFLNAIGDNVDDFHRVAAGGIGQIAKQNIKVDTISNNVGFSQILPNYNQTEKHYEVDSWMDLNVLLASEEDLKGEKVYKLTKSFSFGTPKENTEYVSSFWSTLPNYEGTIDGGGQTIHIEGSYHDIKILNSISNKLKNITIELNLSNFETKLEEKEQIISTSVEGESFNLDENNVKIKGKIATSKTIPWLREKYGTVDLLESEEGLIFTGADSFLTGDGTSDKPYIIDSADGFKEFVSLIKETDSKAYYKITNNINIPYDEEDFVNYVIDAFKGHLDGDGKTLTLGFYSDTTETIGYQSLFGTIDENASVKKLNIKGAFFSAAVAEVNYGVIEDIVVTGETDIVTGFDPVAGIVVLNEGVGVIKNVTNNIDLTSEYSMAAGIAIYNYGQITSAVNNGKINTGHETDLNEFEGHAAGIAIYNYGQINTSTNNADITAGNAGTIYGATAHAAGISVYNYDLIKDSNNIGQIKASNGADGRNPAFLTEEQLAAYENNEYAAYGADGSHAAGIAVFNIGYASNVEEDIPKENEIDENIEKGIVNSYNSGNITAGNGGKKLIVSGYPNSLSGNGGNAAGIVVFNIFLTDEGEEGEIVYRVGVVYLAEKPSDTQTITAGLAGEDAEDGIADFYIAINEITEDGVDYSGVASQFPEEETEE